MCPLQFFGVLMPAAFHIDPAHTSVLSMDCQTAIVSIYAKDEQEEFLARPQAFSNGRVHRD